MLHRVGKQSYDLHRANDGERFVLHARDAELEFHVCQHIQNEAILRHGILSLRASLRLVLNGTIVRCGIWTLRDDLRLIGVPHVVVKGIR